MKTGFTPSCSSKTSTINLPLKPTCRFSPALYNSNHEPFSSISIDFSELNSSNLFPTSASCDLHRNLLNETMNNLIPAELEVRPGGMLVQRRDGDENELSRGDGGDPFIKITVSLGPAQHEVHIPAHSTFAELKRVIEQETGVECERQKILFRGKEKEDGEYLHEAGVKDKGKVLVLEQPISAERKVEEMPKPEVNEREETSTAEDIKEGEQPSNFEVRETEEILKAMRAIDEVRVEVDTLAERVTALEVIVNGGTKIAEKEFVVAAELLMRQLLKLDMIEAGGEARIQRKAEVRRIQNFHELLDSLKAINAKPVDTNTPSSTNTTSNVATVTTDWETFESGVGSLTPPPPGTSSTTASSTAITEDWERFD
ncbi:BAG family molecular chaperone regulator 4 [Linum perenne]